MLGSGSAWPIPRLGCECEQCRSDDPRDARLRPSVLLDGRVLIDAGPDAYAQLRRAGTVPEAVLLTHAHHDHVLGLHDLAKLRRIPLHCTKEAEGDLRRIFGRLDFRVMHLTPGVRVELGEGLEAQAFDVEHDPKFRTVGFRVSDAGGKALVYLPDLAERPSSKLAKRADLLMLDGAVRGEPRSGHMSIEQGVELGRALGAGRTLFTHIGHRVGRHAELEASLPEGCSVAHDGLEVEV